jgi:hypothetical protein
MVILLICLAASAALQWPVAWALVRFTHPGWQWETSSVYPRPAGVAPPVAEVRLENDSTFAVRWVTVTAWSAPIDRATCRSDEDPLFDAEPTWPFRAEDVFPALRDPAAWPAAMPTPGGPLTPGRLYGGELVEAYAIGWPFLTLTGRAVWVPGPAPGPGLWRMQGVTLRPRPAGASVGVLTEYPYCRTPRWPGFAASTLAYAAVLMALAQGARAARGARRRRRGLCVRCAYDLRGLPGGAPCPECGVPARRAGTAH